MDGSGDRFQVRLWDLIVVVVGAAYVLDVARRSRVAWGGGLPDLAHAAGLAVLTLGVASGLVVAGQWALRLRLREGRAWAITWRVVAAGWLAGAMVEVAAALQASGTIPAATMRFDLPTLRLRLTTLMGVLGMVGLVLASAPIGPRSAGDRPAQAPRFGSWPALLLATTLGLAFLGLGHGLFPYLVLMALDFVHNAMQRTPPIARPILFDRMTTASLEALPGLVGCFLTAVWVDDDLRGAVRDPLAARSPRTWRGTLGRFATVALAAAGSAQVVVVSIPKLSPMLAEGLAIVVEPSTMATVALGFAALAAGLAARGAANPVGGTLAVAPPRVRGSFLPSFGPWPGRVVGALVALACLELIASAVQAVRGDLADRWYIPIGFAGWSSISASAAGWLGTPSGSDALRAILDRPDDLLVAIASAWLVVRLAILIGSRQPGGPSPMDAVAVDALAFGRFLGWWAGLATAMVASLPGLAILGVTLVHLAVGWLAR